MAKFDLSKKEIILFSLILILSLALKLSKIGEWPVTIDEALGANAARQIIAGEIAFYEPAVSYQGQFVQYVLIPATFFFGNDVFFIRFSIIIFSILTLLIFYLFVKRYYNVNIALIAAFVLAFTPNDILISTTAIEVPIIPFFMMLSLYIFSFYIRTKKIYYLYALALIFGIGLITRLTFVFFIIAFFASIKIYPTISLPLMQYFKQIKFKNWFVLGSMLILGMSPFLYWNSINNFQTATFILGNLPITQSKQNLFDVYRNFANGSNNFLLSLDNNYRYGFYELGNEKYSYSIIFLISLTIFALFPLIDLNKRKKIAGLKTNYYLLINFFVIIALISTITFTAFEFEDYVMLYPFYSVIIAWSIFSIYKILKLKQSVLSIIFIFVVIVAFSSNLINFVDKYFKLLDAQNSEPCKTLVTNLLPYLKDTTKTLLVFPTDRYRSIYEFYDPSMTSSVLVSRYDTPEQSQIRWDNYLKMQNVTYILINNKCNPEWSRQLNISESFLQFGAMKNKTIITHKILNVNDFEVLKIATVA